MPLHVYCAVADGLPWCCHSGKNRVFCQFREFWLFSSLQSISNWSVSDQHSWWLNKFLTTVAAVNESTIMLISQHFNCISERSWWKYVQFLSLKMEAGPELSLLVGSTLSVKSYDTKPDVSQNRSVTWTQTHYTLHSHSGVSPTRTRLWFWMW